jgi:tetratricopeptide (TPR) repeat protein
VAESLNNLAALYHAQGQYAQAEPLYRRSLAIVEKAVGPEHPAVATTLGHLAELYHAQGQHAQAEALLMRALAIVEKALSPAHLSSGDFVLIDRTEEAYTVYTGIPNNRLGETKAKLSNAPQGIALVTWEAFIHDSDKYVKAQIVKDEYPESRTTAGVVELVGKFPGTPIGLAWNGGIAITYMDYQHAKRIYERYKADPASYERNRNRDPRADPINPKGHLGPLLGW